MKNQLIDIKTAWEDDKLQNILQPGTYLSMHDAGNVWSGLQTGVFA